MINWSAIQYFKPSEFSEDPTHIAEPELIISLDKYRELIDQIIYPSPVSGALARVNGNPNSQHFIGSDIHNPIRKTTGSDIFCEGVPFVNYQIMIASKLFNGVGIYLDTVGPDGLPWIMFHVDIRPKGFNSFFPLVWVTKKIYDPKTKKHKNSYYYPQAEPSKWNLFNDYRLYNYKQFGTPIASTVNSNDF